MQEVSVRVNEFKLKNNMYNNLGVQGLLQPLNFHVPNLMHANVLQQRPQFIQLGELIEDSRITVAKEARSEPVLLI
jgi:hypothetical protein